MKFHIECEREADGRWLAEMTAVPGAMCYGTTPNEAMRKAEALSLRAIAERLENDEAAPFAFEMTLAAA